MTSKRWVYGTRTRKWVLVGPEDRDYIHGIPEDVFKEIGPIKARLIYLGFRMI